LIKCNYGNLTLEIYSQMGAFLHAIPFKSPLDRSTAFHGARAWMKANQELVYDVDPELDNIWPPEEGSEQYTLDLEPIYDK